MRVNRSRKEEYNRELRGNEKRFTQVKDMGNNIQVGLLNLLNTKPDIIFEPRTIHFFFSCDKYN